MSAPLDFFWSSFRALNRDREHRDAQTQLRRDFFVEANRLMSEGSYRVAHVVGLPAAEEVLMRTNPRCRWVVHLSDREIDTVGAAELSAIAEFATLICTSSDTKREELCLKVPGISTVCFVNHPGVDQRLTKIRSKPAESQTVLFASPFSPESGLPWALLAFKHIVETNPQAQLMAVETEESQAWDERALERWKALERFGPEISHPRGFAKLIRHQAREVGHFVTFERGRHAEPSNYYARAGIFIYPSVEDRSVQPVLDAMAAGLPVIVARTAALAEIVQPGIHGLLVNPGDIYEFSDALRLLLDQPGLRARMGRAGRELIQQRFLWSRTVARLDEVSRPRPIAVTHGTA